MKHLFGIFYLETHKTKLFLTLWPWHPRLYHCSRISPDQSVFGCWKPNHKYQN